METIALGAKHLKGDSEMAEQATEKDMAEAQVLDEIEKPDVEYEPLFESEKVSEEDLKGEATEDKAAASAPEGEAKKEETEAPKEETKGLEKEPEKTKEEPKEEPKEEAVKPPPGYVPLQAVHDERAKVKSLKAEIERLKAEKAVTKDATEEDEFKDFKVMSAAEYKNLWESDPDEAAMYMYKLNLYKDHKAETESRESAKRKAEQAMKEIVEEGAQEIEKILPGFHKGENKDAPELAKFAINEGFSESILFDLTNPETTIIGKDGNRYSLGTGAAKIINMLKRTKASSEISEESIRKKLEEELRPKIEEELKKTVLSKIKDPSGDYQSLDKATPSGSKQTKTFSGVLTEAQFARLSEADKEAYLRG